VFDEVLMTKPCRADVNRSAAVSEIVGNIGPTAATCSGQAGGQFASSFARGAP